MRLLALLACAAGCWTSCSSTQHKQTAEAAVQAFHTQLDAERYAEIHRGAHEDFRKSAREGEITEFLAAIHRKLGNVQSSSQEGWQVFVTTSGTRVHLNYKTQFANGPATERFTWMIVDGRATLLGYNIDSRLLIVN
ncbi:MAG: DUF4019 domain-containing protein [Terriglobales bacterium]